MRKALVKRRVGKLRLLPNLARRRRVWYLWRQDQIAVGGRKSKPNASCEAAGACEAPADVTVAANSGSKGWDAMFGYSTLKNLVIGLLSVAAGLVVVAVAMSLGSGASLVLCHIMILG
jgi:hypothetical protein